MKIIISPAKKMNEEEDLLEVRGLPVLLDRTQILLDYMRGLDRSQAKALWKCNDAIADLNYSRIQKMDLRARLSPAVIAYEGIQYQYMAPKIMGSGELDYLEEHLRILSGFYGILRPFDGVRPYRLEMQAGVLLEAGGKTFKSLYAFWGDSLYRELTAKDRVIVNLASKEYSRGAEPFLEPDVRFVNVVFGSLARDAGGREKIKVKATEAKMARGEMVRFLAENRAGDPEAMKAFDRLGFVYSEKYSGEDEFVFLRQTERNIEENEAGGSLHKI